MKKRKTILKRVLSFVLAITMVIGVATVSEPKKAVAADDALEVSLDLISAGASWSFSHSDLPDNYQGTEEPWIGVRYQFDAYKDGSTQTETVWIEFVGSTASIYGELAYADKKVPVTSLRVPKGTVLYECTYNQ